MVSARLWKLSVAVGAILYTLLAGSAVADPPARWDKQSIFAFVTGCLHRPGVFAKEVRLENIQLSYKEFQINQADSLNGLTQSGAVTTTFPAKGPDPDQPWYMAVLSFLTKEIAVTRI